MSEKFYTISAYTENTPGVLHRITTSFTKRKINVESLTVSETEKKGISVFTIVVKSEEQTIQTIIKQLKRIIEVIDVYAFEDSDILYSEVALIKVLTKNDTDRAKIEEITLRYEGSVLNIDQESVVVQIVGSYDRIKTLFKLLESFGIEKFVRSGRIALAREGNLGFKA